MSYHCQLDVTSNTFTAPRRKYSCQNKATHSILFKDTVIEHYSCDTHMAQLMADILTGKKQASIEPL